MGEQSLLREKENRENLLIVKGKSREPKLRIGGRAKLSDINDKAMEIYRILEITHYLDGDTYWNEFVGIPDIFVSPYVDENAFAKCEDQPAIVKDNNDPQGLGRVRVQFIWQRPTNEYSPWIRVVQPHGGSGKGFYFIPEIDEEVMVSFENQNAERPYVIGSHYNGKSKSGYATAGNDKKVIHTRSGTKIILNDAEGSVFIEDPSGNTYFMDGQGNINVNAPKNMTFTAGENVNISAGMNVSVNAGMNITESAGMNHNSFAGAMMMQNAVADYSLMAANIMEVAQGERKSKAKEVTDQSGKKNIISQETNSIHSKGKLNNNSGDKSNLF
ncbi:phage baseplate assembly protein V [Bergeyella sp. RCAD1439]|uniref:phage baseplate assembly protein V n=1 Tax=Bergeyella anatis TaxID=3113737 RepID=UPI002E184796|nr:phage baseplate assembly protein V [Bergeyella sp. RCAD1439]